jgi:hypothetical protein
VKPSSKWWAVPYVVGVAVFVYLAIFTKLGAKIYGGISIALMVWFFCFSVYTLVHLLWLWIRRKRSTKVVE